jgi:hypothetical protein
MVQEAGQGFLRLGQLTTRAALPTVDDGQPWTGLLLGTSGVGHGGHPLTTPTPETHPVRAPALTAIIAHRPAIRSRMPSLSHRPAAMPPATFT